MVMTSRLNLKSVTFLAQGVESVTVDDKAIKFLLNSEGAFYDDIRSALNFGESAGSTAARKLIEITVARWSFCSSLIVTPVKVTNLLGGSEGTASIGYEEEQPADGYCGGWRSGSDHY